MSNNSGIIGVAAVLLIAVAAGQGGAGLAAGPGRGFADYAGQPGGSGSSMRLIKAFELTGLLRDLHRMTDIMNRMDHLGQMVLNPPPLPKLPPAGELLGKTMPDLSGILENIGPIMAAFNGMQGGLGGADGENENDIF